MGTLIETVATAKPSSFQPGIKHNSIKLAADAASSSIKKAKLDPDQIAILVNTGIYRTDNIGEPAMAAVIQNMIKGHPFWKLKKRKQTTNQTFSFDLINGGCGFINAIQLVDSMMHSGNLLKGLIVTVDVEPILGYSKGYNFAPIAAALILTPGENEKKGFVKFRSDTYLEYKDSFKGQLVFSETKQKSMIIIDQSKAYLKACLACTEDSIKKFLEADKLSLNDIDLIIPSQTPLGLPEALNQIPGLKDKTVMTGFEPGELHTAGPAYALEQIWNRQAFKKAKNILFVTVSAGITTAIALYRK